MPQSAERSAAQIVSYLQGESGMVRVGPSLEYSLQQIVDLVAGAGAASTWQRSGPGKFVAASDAMTTSITGTDYPADGTADDADIQAAIAALPS